MTWLVAASMLVVGTLGGLRVWAYREDKALDATWQRLIATAPAETPRFDPASIAGLPEPARRYLSASIRPGMPLARVAEITMHGELGLGTRDEPGYRPMRACQLLAAPDGFVWQVATGAPPLAITGSDGAERGSSWTRFRIAQVVPVVRGGDEDHLHASFGRYVSDAVFLTPAALMPSDNVRREAAGKDIARVTVSRGQLSQVVDITRDGAGHPVSIVFERWSDANADKSTTACSRSVAICASFASSTA